MSLALCLVVGATTAGSSGCGGADGEDQDADAPILLTLHPGGFILGNPGLEDQAGEIASANGFRPVSVEYQLGDVEQAVRDATEAARRYGRGGTPVYAYGESAGGTLAAILAREGLVRRAAVYAPVADIPGWSGEQLVYLGIDTKRARALSPLYAGRSEAPVLALVPQHDTEVPPGPTRRWARLDPNVKARSVPGGHEFAGSPGYEDRVEIALDFLEP